MKLVSRLLFIGTVILALGLAPTLFAADGRSDPARQSAQSLSSNAIQSAATPLIRLRPPSGVLIALPTATPTPSAFKVRSRAIDAAIAGELLKLAPTPPPAVELGVLSPGTIVRPSKVVIGRDLGYLTQVQRVDPERLSALGMDVTNTGAQEQLQIMNPDHLKILTTIAADAIGTLGQPPPFLACNSSINVQTLGSVVRGAISESGVPCAYTFTGDENDHYNLTVSSSAFSPWLDVFDPNGDYLEPVTDDPGEDGASRFRGYVLPSTGVYTVIVRPTDESATGDFQLTISPLNMVLLSANLCLRDIALGQSLTDETLKPGMRCFYEFNGTANSPVNISMDSPDGKIDPVIELNDPNGIQETSNDDVSAGDRNSLIANHVLQSSGLYVIVAHAYAETEGGQFDLSLSSAPPPPTPTPSLCGGVIRYGQPVDESIRSVGGECRYELTGASGDIITIEMTRQDSQLDPYVTLLSPAGDTLKSDDDGAGNRNSRIRNYRLGQAGVFTIVAGSYHDASSGPFTLTVRK
jgi:hypothetical protein